MAFLILRPRDQGCAAGALPRLACCDFYRAINATVHVLRQRLRLVDRSPTIKTNPKKRDIVHERACRRDKPAASWLVHPGPPDLPSLSSRFTRSPIEIGGSNGRNVRYFSTPRRRSRPRRLFAGSRRDADSGHRGAGRSTRTETEPTITRSPERSRSAPRAALPADLSRFVRTGTRGEGRRPSGRESNRVSRAASKLNRNSRDNPPTRAV